MAEERARIEIARYEARLRAQASMRSVWQLLADLWRPAGETFTSTRTPGKDARRGRVFNSAHIHAANVFTAALEDLIIPKRRPWFHLTVGHDDKKLSEAAQDWLESTRRAATGAIYRLDAGFDAMLDGLLSSVAELGVGVGFVAEVAGRPQFWHIPSSEIVWDRDENGKIDLVLRQCRRSLRYLDQRARRLVQPWALHDTIRQRIERAQRSGEGWDDEVTVLYSVRPRGDGERPVPGDTGFARRLPYAEYVIDVENKHVMFEGGYHEMPYLVVVWSEPHPDNIWSPARSALPDTLALQRMTEDMLHGWRGVSRPPYFAPNDFNTSLGGLLLGPNAVNYYDPAAIPGNRPPVEVLQLNVDLQRLYQGILEWEDKVRRHFFNHLFLLGSDERGQMTATEVLRRNNDLLRVAGSMFGKIEAQLNHPLVARVLAILRRAAEAAGWAAENGSPLDPPPGELDFERDPLRVVIENDMARARRLVGVAQVGAGLEVALPLVQLRPEAAEVVKTEHLLRAVLDSQLGPGYARSDDETEERQARVAQAAQAQAAADAAPKLAQAAERVAGLPVASLADVRGRA